MKSGIFFSDELLNYNLGENHPMNSSRLETAWNLFNSIGIDSNTSIYNPKPAKHSDIETIHSVNYVDEVKRLAKESVQGKQSLYKSKFGLGTGDCPIFPEMYNASLLISGSMLQAADLIIEGEINKAFLLMGGLHHAQYSRSSGFCYFNDMSIVIDYLKRKGGYRIAYIDTDLHHGDGTQALAYNDPEILTISYHESGRWLYPGTGFSNEIGKSDAKGTSVNLPLMPYTYDKMYVEAFDQFVPTILNTFDPDFIVWQAGVDGHVADHLGHLLLTTNTYQKLGEKIRDFADHYCEGRLIVAGGGGYSPYSIARSWFVEFASINRINIPKKTPIEWQEDYSKRFQYDVPKLMHDDEITPTQIAKLEVIEEGNQIYRSAFIEELSPFYNLKGE